MVPLKFVCAAALFASGYCMAAPSLLAVYEKGAYPAPGEGSGSGGLRFEVCADGSVFRAYGGSHAERGLVTGSVLREFRKNIESRWLGPLRSECRALGISPDAPYLEIESGTDEFECSLQAGKDFEVKVLALHLEKVASVERRAFSVCN